VSFNDHEGSTKSYLYTRQHELNSFVPLRKEISAESGEAGGVPSVTMRDDSIVRFRKPHAQYSPTDLSAGYSHVKECNAVARSPPGCYT
jgi:2-oxoglutarate ferredoxin oxidoreductase subunit beta